ncbi:MAG: VWA domain-containing protein [Bryobacteraceae bacterium]|jgi:VWFA-related protein
MFSVRVGLRRRTLQAVLLGAFCCAQSVGQAPPAGDGPEVSSHEAPITFSTRVNLISVPVVVRDREGRAVGNLRQEDFQLLDKGKLQVITKFSMEKSDRAVEIDAGTSKAPGEKTQAPALSQSALPEHYVAYLVDDIHLKPGDLLATRQSMNRHLDEAIDPASRAAIFATSGLMLTDFTADRDKLHNAVNKIQPYTSGIDRQQNCPYISYYVADLLVNQDLYLDGRLFSDQQLFGIIEGHTDPVLSAAYDEAVACIGCPPGNDQLTGLPMCALQGLTKLREAARLALNYGDHETAGALGALRDVVRKITAMPGTRNLVLVSPGFLLTRDHRADEYDVLERAIRANVVVNTIDMRGLFTTIPSGDASQPPYHTAEALTFLEQADTEAATQADDVLAELANGTGGTFFHNNNDLKRGLNVLAARPEYVYVLGFSPQELKFDGSYHGLKVTLKHSPNLTIQARRGYWAPRHAVDSAEAAKEEIQETVFSREEVQAIPLEVQTEFFESGDQKFELTVTAQLDVKGLRFNRSQDRNDDTLTVVAGLFDPDGNYIAGVEKVVELHLRDRTLEAFQNAGINVKENFNVAPGRYLVRVVVRDSGGKTITARNGGVEIP